MPSLSCQSLFQQRRDPLIEHLFRGKKFRPLFVTVSPDRWVLSKICLTVKPVDCPEKSQIGYLVLLSVALLSGPLIQHVILPKY